MKKEKRKDREDRQICIVFATALLACALLTGCGAAKEDNLSQGIALVEQMDYEGALTWSISRDATRYVLVVRQGDNAVTLLFEKLDLEVHLYNYGEIAHFWVPGYEYLRQLEYRIAILRDKCEGRNIVRPWSAAWPIWPISRR